MIINNHKISLRDVLVVMLVAAAIVSYMWKGDGGAAIGFGIAALCVFNVMS